MATVARDVADLEYFERTHTLYAPMERVDMLSTWDYRRDRESRKDYRGGSSGTRARSASRRIARSRAPCRFPCSGIVPDRPGQELRHALFRHRRGRFDAGRPVRDEKKPVPCQGRIRPGGYAAFLTTPVGYHGLLVPADMDFAYQAALPS